MFYRTVLVTAAVLLAVAVPTIGPFIGLIGAFCFSILGLLIPVSCTERLFNAIQVNDFIVSFQVAIEMVTYWDSGFGPFNWIIYKNIFVTIFGVLALVFGSKSAIEAIVDLYAVKDAVLVTAANITQSSI